MKHILERREWTRLNEAYFSKGSAFEKSKEKAIAIMSKLSDKGLSPVAAAAVVGNMFKESVFDPNARSPDVGYVGLCQWGGPRKAKLMAKPKWNTVDTQIDFIMDELATLTYFDKATQKKVLIKDAITNAATPEKAAELFARRYEVCADPTSEKRINGAKEIHDIYVSQIAAFTGPDSSADVMLDEPVP